MGTAERPLDGRVSRGGSQVMRAVGIEGERLPVRHRRRLARGRQPLGPPPASRPLVDGPVGAGQTERLVRIESGGRARKDDASPVSAADTLHEGGQGTHVANGRLQEGPGRPGASLGQALVEEPFPPRRDPAPAGRTPPLARRPPGPRRRRTPRGAGRGVRTRAAAGAAGRQSRRPPNRKRAALEGQEALRLPVEEEIDVLHPQVARPVAGAQHEAFVQLALPATYHVVVDRTEVDEVLVVAIAAPIAREALRVSAVGQ